LIKIKIFILFVFISQFIFAEEFLELISKMSIYEYTIQAKTDSLLVNLYPNETMEEMTNWLVGSDYMRRNIALRLLGKFKDKEPIKNLLIKKKIDALYGFRIFRNDTLNFFTEYEKPLKVYQYESFIKMVESRGWKEDGDEIIKIIKSKNIPDYIVVQGLNGLLMMAERDKSIIDLTDEKFYFNLFKKENSAIDDAAIKLMALQNSFCVESIFAETKSIRDKINLVRFYNAIKDTVKINNIVSFYDADGEKTNLSYMLDYEVKEYLTLFGDSILSEMVDDEKYLNIRDLIIKTKGAINGQ